MRARRRCPQNIGAAVLLDDVGAEEGFDLVEVVVEAVAHEGGVEDALAAPAEEGAPGGVDLLAEVGGVDPAGEPLLRVFDGEEAGLACGGVLALHEVGQLGGRHGLPVALARVMHADAEIVDESVVGLVEDIDEAGLRIVVQMELMHDLF